MAHSSPKRILLVDSQPVVRERLTQLICAEPGLAVCGEAADAVSTIRLLQSTNPDLVVLGLALPDRHGLELIREIRRRRKKLRVLVFSLYSEELYAERVIRAGAHGYVSKNQPTAEVLVAIRRILDGELHLSPKMLIKVAGQHLGQIQSTDGSISRMSDRELQVFELIGSGHGSTEIASRLGVTVKTIEAYCERLKTKLNLPSAAKLRQAAIRALHSGKLHTIVGFLLPWLSALTDCDFDLDLM